MTDDTEREWHLDKRVPIALILAILVQTATVIWWARGLDARVSALEEGKGATASQSNQLNNIATDVAVLKSQMGDIKIAVEKLTDIRRDNPAR